MPLLQTKADASAWGYGFLGATAPTGAFQKIASVTAAGSETSLSFNSIPGTYRALQIRAISSDNDTAAISVLPLKFQFNGDSGNNYWYHFLGCNGAATNYASNSGAATSAGMSYSGVRNSGNFMSATVIDFIDYASSNKYKTVKAFGGLNNNTGSANLYAMETSSLWMNTAPITSIVFLAPSTTFKAGSNFALYGIR